MPCDYSKYPGNWKTEIRPRILARDNNCCVTCGVPNYSIGYWGNDGKFYSAEVILEALETTGRDMFSKGEPLEGIDGDKKPIKIVLTVAHLDHNLQHNEDENLKALCQRHHLEHDKDYHRENARKTNNKKKGLQNLFNEGGI